jgi:hypothetical protein
VRNIHAVNAGDQRHRQQHGSKQRQHIEIPPGVLGEPRRQLFLQEFGALVDLRDLFDSERQVLDAGLERAAIRFRQRLCGTMQDTPEIGALRRKFPAQPRAVRRRS